MITSMSFYPFGTEDKTTDLTNAQNDAARVEERIPLQETRIASWEPIVELCKKHHPTMYQAALQARNTPHNWKERLLTSYLRWESGIARTLEYEKQQLSGLLNTYNNFQAQIVSLKKFIAENAKRFKHITWTVDDVTTMLKDVPNVVPNSVEFLTDDGVLSWKYSGLQMRPDPRPINLETPENWGVPLTDITVTVNMREAKVYFRGENEIRTFHDVEVCHPHIMSDYAPCWGSFDYMVFDCMERGDITSLGIVIHMFLQQANSEDTAGRCWVKWMDGARGTANTDEIHVKIGDRLYVAYIAPKFEVKENDPRCVHATDRSMVVGIKSTRGVLTTVPPELQKELQDKGLECRDVYNNTLLWRNNR